MKKYVVVLIIVIFSTKCFSQQIIQGRIESSADRKPISYANIGILNTSVGTLSNEDGTFTLRIPEKHLTDTILFSALGFVKINVPVQQLLPKQTYIVVLPEKITTLRQVVVTAKRDKQETYALGNKYQQGGFLYADSISAGSAMALLIDNKYPSYHKHLTYPFFVKGVRFFIDKNSTKAFKMRLRFVEPDSTGAPGNDLLAENVVVNSSIIKGWIEMDVSSYNFVADKPFFLVIEWIMEDKDRLALLNEYTLFKKANPQWVTSDSTEVDGKKIGFWNYHHFSPGTHLGVSAIPFSLQNYVCYYRTNSFGVWLRSPVVLTARVDVVPVN